MKVLYVVANTYSSENVATLAGKGTGHVVQAFRAARGSIKNIFRRMPFPQLFSRAPRSFEAVLRQAILTESQRSGRNLSEKEIDELVTKILTLLEKVLSGELGVDAIPWAMEMLRSKDALADFVTPLFKTAGPLSEARVEMLKQILAENVRLQKEIKEEEMAHE